jgi:magnesium chelatase family protein
MEHGAVTIARTARTSTFPARFMLVAAMNPCPCGRAGDPSRPCGCDEGMRRRYTGRVSGPLLDRVDLCVTVPAVSWGELAKAGRPESSSAIRARVEEARRRAAARGSGGTALRNADLTVGQLERLAALDGAGRELAESAVSRLNLSVRGLHRALRVARTVADLEASESVGAAHLAEAISYRLRTGPDQMGRIDGFRAGR